METVLLRQAGNITGTLPDSWAGPGAFPKLLILNAEGTHIKGTIPESWTLPRAFPQLQVLALTTTGLHGPVPCFNNSRLNAVLLDNCWFDSTMDAVWSSPAPLQILSLGQSFITGSLPDVPLTLGQLTFLDASQNQLRELSRYLGYRKTSYCPTLLCSMLEASGMSHKLRQLGRSSFAWSGPTMI